MAEIDGVEEWLIGQALGSPDMAKMFAELCERLRECNVPIDRGMLAWSALHPLIEAEIAFWENGSGYLFEQIGHHEEETDEWLQSPVRAVLLSRDRVLRRNLTSGNAPAEFPLLTKLAGNGYTDYLVIRTEFNLPVVRDDYNTSGIIVSWSTKDKEGFSDEALVAIEYIQKRLALAARATLESQITKTIAETYLGSIAGTKVLNGQIRRGDGETIDAVIFYSDMRNSTGIAEDLGPKAYLPWLNRYFEATAGAVLEHGGEVLDFIGDAVLAVFPTEGQSFETAVTKALKAADETTKRLQTANEDINGDHKLEVGVALSVGSVMFGNIGVPHRLTFSVVGQTVHAAARIESLTKFVGSPILMTEQVAAIAGKRARPVGEFELNGFSERQPLFALEK